MERLRLRRAAAWMASLYLLLFAAGCGERIPTGDIADPGITERAEPEDAAKDETPAAPETEAPGTEAADTESPATEAPATEAPETEPPATDAPATETPEITAPETEIPPEDSAETAETEPVDTDAVDPSDAGPSDTDAPDAKVSESDSANGPASGEEEEPAETEEPEETNIAGVVMTEVLRLRERDEAARKEKEAKKEAERIAKEAAEKLAREEEAKRASGAYSYLTGLPCYPEQQKKRPVAIMLNNLKLQLPQFGLDYGEIFYECVTEGSITRLMMLTTDYENMGTVGSIRSSREVFANRVPDYDAVYVHAGGSPGAYNIISEKALASLDGANMYLPSTYFRDQWRLNNIGYEHSLMTNGAGIISGIQFKGYRTELKADYTPPFTFYNEQNNHLTGGPAAVHVRLCATPIQTVDYVYDAASGQYLRYQYNGMSHVDGSTGKQIAVKNVLVLFMDIGVIPGDEKSRVAVTDVGTGSGYYMTNGQRAEIVWSRASNYDTMHYSYADGTPLVLNAGKTFINIVETAAANTISFNYQW